MRERLGLTQQALAELMDKKRNTISGYESGDSFPNFNDLLTMAKILKVGLDDLVFGNFDSSDAQADMIAAEPSTVYNTDTKVKVEERNNNLVITIHGAAVDANTRREIEDLKAELEALKASLKGLKKE